MSALLHRRRLCEWKHNTNVYSTVPDDFKKESFAFVLVVRVSTLRFGSRVLIPGRVIPKPMKMVPDTSLLGSVSVKGWFEGKTLRHTSIMSRVHQAASHYRNGRQAPALCAFMTLKVHLLTYWFQTATEPRTEP